MWWNFSLYSIEHKRPPIHFWHRYTRKELSLIAHDSFNFDHYRIGTIQRDVRRCLLALSLNVEEILNNSGGPASTRSRLDGVSYLHSASDVADTYKDRGYLVMTVMAVELVTTSYNLNDRTFDVSFLSDSNSLRALLLILEL